jgi:hypothetical protein
MIARDAHYAHAARESAECASDGGLFQSISKQMPDFAARAVIAGRYRTLIGLAVTGRDC